MTKALATAFLALLVAWPAAAQLANGGTTTTTDPASTAIDDECSAFDDPTIDPALSWEGLDLTGFSKLSICTPIFTPSGLRMEVATYPDKVGRCVVSVNAREYEFSPVLHPGQLLVVMLSDAIVDPSGSVLTSAWCEDPAGGRGAVVADVVTVVPIPEPPSAPLRSAP